MQEYTPNVFANRDEPLPLLTISRDDLDTSSSESDKPDKSSSTGRKDKTLHVNDGTSPVDVSSRQSLQDRVFNKLFSQIIPSEDLEASHAHKDEKHAAEHVARPAFSLTIMGNNFRRFNARIGVVFVFQNQVAQLLGWQKPSHTLSLLAVYTFICLDPYLLIALPLAVALLFVMVPAFTARHPPPPPPPTASSSVKDHAMSAYSYSGPAIAPAKTIQPAPETSKDFFRNMRDLQNSMADFSNLHDALVDTIAPATNFSNEVLSSTIFLYLTVLTAVAFISAQLIPFRLISLLGGYAAIFSGHPTVAHFLAKQAKRAEKRAQRLSESSNKDDQDSTVVVAGIPVKIPDTKIAHTVQSTLSAVSQITLSTTAETREVEIFELQHRPILPATSSASSYPVDPEANEWSPYLFTASPYDPLSPSRIAGEWPKGTRFFEDVQPPVGWEWANKKWILDLEVGEWVNERLIVGVEYDVMRADVDDDNLANSPSEAFPNDNPSIDITDITDSESKFGQPSTATTSFAAQRKRKQSINLDFGGWVWDLPPAVGSTGNRDEEVWLAYGDYEIPSASQESDQNKSKTKGHKKNSSSKGSVKGQKADWEEGMRLGNKGRTGEWRRRRWVRVVKRKTVGDE